MDAGIILVSKIKEEVFFMKEYLDMWRGYFDFSGRTTVRGYWMATLFNFIFSFVVGLVDGLLGLGILATLYSIAVFIPGLAMSIRRLRDAGKSWGWYFINFVPLVGWIIFIVMLCKPSVAPQQTTYSQSNDYYQY